LAAKSKEAPVTPAEFFRLLEVFSPHLEDVKKIAVAVSGGPDSMALARLLSLWGEKNKAEVHMLTVDHGLRTEAAREAKAVATALKGWPSTRHAILRWKGRKPASRIMEAAREARYKLMTDYCREHEIGHLFLAHHQDDQAETFLFRLAKGSGLDGLTSIRPVWAYGDLLLLRPFLSVSKQRLESTCNFYKLPFVKDPSNRKRQYARPRLRNARSVLEKEGLTSKRLAVTAARLERARAALDEMAQLSFRKCVSIKNTDRIVLNKGAWDDLPAEIALRVLIVAIETLRPNLNYRPRMEKIESLFSDLRDGKEFRKRTLGSLVFARGDRKDIVSIALEKKPSGNKAG
jgi:tRNA(Ile)-lysidine synthase